MASSPDPPAVKPRFLRRTWGGGWLKARNLRGDASATLTRVRRWWAGRVASLRRWPPIPYSWLVMSLVGLGIAQQALFFSRYDPALMGGRPPEIFPARFIIPFLFGYIALALRLLTKGTAAALNRLRPVVKLDTLDYDTHIRQTLTIPRWHIGALFAINLVLHLYLYVVLRVQFPLGMGLTLPSDAPAAVLAVGTFVVLGGLLYTLVYVCVRFSIGLRRLALLYSLTLAGLIMTLVVPLGLPTAFEDYLVVILTSMGSLWALVGPLWGVHRQMLRAKQEVLERVHDQFREIQDMLLDGTRFTKEELDELSARAEKLVKLRALVWDAPNWPFRSSSSALRAVLAVLTPLSLVVLQEIVKALTSHFMGSP